MLHTSPIIEWHGIRLDLSIILMLIVSCTVVFLLAFVATRRLSVESPGKLQNFMEWVVDFVKGLISSNMDMKRGRPFLSLGLTLIMFIFVSNMLGLPFGIVTDYHDKEHAHIFGTTLVSVTEQFDKLQAQQAVSGTTGEEIEVGVAWWKSPTADAGVSMGLAIMIFVLIHFLGITRNTRNYFKHYVQPNVAFLPINLIEQFSKVLTHGMRLFGNIFAGEVLISVLLKMAALGVGGYIASVAGLVAWQGFSIFVGSIQAFVFTILTFVYISQALESHDDHKHEH